MNPSYNLIIKAYYKAYDEPIIKPDIKPCDETHYNTHHKIILSTPTIKPQYETLR